MFLSAALSILASTFLFSVVGVLVKLSSRTMPDGMIVFFRNAGALAALLPFLYKGGLEALKTRRPGAHLARSLAGLGSMYCCFYALARMHIGDAMLLCYTTPLFMPLLASLWIGEQVSPVVWKALGLGFLGVGLVMKPGGGLFTPAAAVALASAGFGAVAQVGIRDLTKTEPVRRIVFYFAAVSTVCSALPLVWCWRTPGAWEWGLLVGTGVIASAAQLFLTRAYSKASPAHVGPFIYAAVLFSVLWDWILWRHRPDLLSVAGGALIVLAGVRILRKGTPAAPAPRAQK
jgi:drug/metabolite transporter (DMT)-like permease